MNNRYTPFLILGILVLPMFTLGPEQYGYAFFGILSFLGQFAEIIGAESLIWALILNFAIIGLMILFSFFGLAALISPISIALIKFKEKTKRIVKLPPVIFSGIVLFGLTGFLLFPANPNLEIGKEFFYAPALLLLISSLDLFMTKRTEQGGGINSVTAPPPLHDTP